MPAALFTLQALLAGKTFLFVGFSLSDEYFVKQLTFINEIFGGAASAFYVVLQEDEKNQNHFPSFVHPITYESYGEPLVRLIREMSEVAHESSSSNIRSSKNFDSGNIRPNLNYRPCNIPFPSKGEGFIGRSGKAEEIRNTLKKNNLVAIGQAISVSGIGGLGKTQLAVEYAHRYGNQYANGIIWLTANEDIESQLIILAQKTGWVHPEMPVPEQLERAKKRLRTYNDCLIIFDDLEDFDAVKEYIPYSGVESHIIATSRYEQRRFEPIDLDLLSTEDSRRLLIVTAGRQPNTQGEEQALTQLVEILDGLPLAIELAGAYLKHRKSVTWQNYLEMLQFRMSEALPDKFLENSFTNHEQGVFQTLKITEDILKESTRLGESSTS